MSVLGEFQEQLCSFYCLTLCVHAEELRHKCARWKEPWKLEVRHALHLLSVVFYSPLDCVFSHTVRRGSCHSQRSKGSQEKVQREQSLAWISRSLLKGLELVGLDEAFQFQACVTLRIYCIFLMAYFFRYRV